MNDNPKKPYTPRGEARNHDDRPRREAPREPEEQYERIAKRLARAGIASRREAESIIAAGRIAVNGRKITSPALNVGMSAEITMDGKPIPAIERTRLWLYNKPGGLVTSNRDPEGRPTVFDNLPKDLPRVLSIGRLDINTEGLLLLTNDGGLARALELPQTGWLRRYRVRAHGSIRQAQLDDLKNGIAVDGVFYGAIEAKIEREQGSNMWLEIGIREGKNREVKNVLGALGLEVNRLIRISYGPFRLGELPEGHVLEVKGKVLQEQLGPALVEQSGANFEAPVLNPFPNRPVSKREEDAPHISVEKKGDWVSGTRDSGKPEGGKSGARGPKKERGERRSDEPLSRLSTKPPEGFKSKGDKKFEKKTDRKFDNKGGRDDERPVEPRASRSSNVWMAPGARPGAKPRPKADGKPSRPARDGDRPQRSGPSNGASPRGRGPKKG